MGVGGRGTRLHDLARPALQHRALPDRPGWGSPTDYLHGAVGAALLGRLADLHGKRQILMVTVVVSGVGATICAFAPNLGIVASGAVITKTERNGFNSNEMWS